MKYFIHLWLATMVVIVLAVSCTLSNQEAAEASARGIEGDSANPRITAHGDNSTVEIPAGAPGTKCDGPYEVWAADYPGNGGGQMGSGTAQEALARLAQERDVAGEPRIAGETEDEVTWQWVLEDETIGRATVRHIAVSTLPLAPCRWLLGRGLRLELCA